VREPLVRPHAMKGLNPQPPAREDRP